MQVRAPQRENVFRALCNIRICRAMLKYQCYFLVNALSGGFFSAFPCYSFSVAFSLVTIYPLFEKNTSKVFILIHTVVVTFIRTFCFTNAWRFCAYVNIVVLIFSSSNGFFLSNLFFFYVLLVLSYLFQFERNHVYLFFA